MFSCSREKDIFDISQKFRKLMVHGRKLCLNKPMMISKIGGWEKNLGFELFQLMKMNCGIVMFRTKKIKISLLIVISLYNDQTFFFYKNSILQKNNENGCCR